MAENNIFHDKGFPTPLECALISNLAYDDSHACPESWTKVVTVAAEDNRDYHGVAYVNAERNVLVIGHRGTHTLEDVVKSDFAIAFKNVPDPYKHAKSFSQALRGDKTYKDYKIVEVGHSLGGFYAQLNVASFQESRKDLDYAVTFDAPGSKNALLIEIGEDRVRKLKQEKLVTFLSAPNIVNTANQHVGTLYRVFIPHKNRGANIVPAFEVAFNTLNIGSTFSWMLSALHGVTKQAVMYDYAQHQLVGMIACMNKKTGFPYLLRLVYEWPSTSAYLYSRTTNWGIYEYFSEQLKDVPRGASDISDISNRRYEGYASEIVIYRKFVLNLADKEKIRQNCDLEFFQKVFQEYAFFFQQVGDHNFDMFRKAIEEVCNLLVDKALKDAVLSSGNLVLNNIDVTLLDTEMRTWTQCENHIRKKDLDKLKYVFESLLPDVVKRLVSCRRADGTSYTLLWYAVYQNSSLDVINFLIEKGASISTPDKSSGWSPLHCAVKNGNLDIINCLFSKTEYKRDLASATDNKQRIPLFYTEQPKIVKLLLEYGSDVCQRDTDGAFALWRTSNNGFGVMVDLALTDYYKRCFGLIKKTPAVEESLSAEPTQSVTPIKLDKTTQEKWDSAVKSIKEKTSLQHFANLDASLKETLLATQDSYGYTLLHWAVYSENYEALTLLLDQLPEHLRPVLAFKTMKEKDSVLHLASRPKKSAAIQYDMITKLLQKRSDPSARNDAGNTPLHEILFSGYNAERKSSVLALLDTNVNINAQNAQGDTPLHLTEDDEMVSILITRGADVCIQNKYKRSVLWKKTNYWFAVRIEQISFAVLKYVRDQLVLQHPTIPKTDLPFKKSPISYTLVVGQSADAAKAKDYGLDTETQSVRVFYVKSTDSSKPTDYVHFFFKGRAQSPISKAVNASQKLKLEKLFELTASETEGLKYASVTPITALQFSELLAIMDAYDAQPEPLDDSSHRDCISDIKASRYKTLTHAHSLFHGPKMIASMLRFNSPDGFTWIHYAAKFGKPGEEGDKIVRWMIDDLGADVNGKDKQGMTPLHHAVAEGKFTLCEILLRKGAMVNIQDFSGKTPLHFASTSYGEKIFTLLLSYGADITIKDNSQVSPMRANTNDLNREFAWRVDYILFQAFRVLIRYASSDPSGPTAS